MRRLVAAMGALAAIMAGSSHAQLLGLSSTNPGVLYDINPTTGVATVRTPISEQVSGTGLDFLSGTLYATDVFPNEVCCSFGSINVTTGAFTPINNQGGSTNWQGLAGNEGAGLLYTIDLDDNNILKSITPGGVITSIGTGTGIDGRGMAFDEDTNTLYATGGPAFGVQSLFTVNTTSGTATLIGSTGVASLFVGLAFDQLNDVLYLIADPDNIGAGSANLYTLNASTGAATLIGPTGVSVIDGLAWLQPSQAASEPTTLALFGIALAGLGFSRRRRAA